MGFPCNESTKKLTLVSESHIEKNYATIICDTPHDVIIRGAIIRGRDQSLWQKPEENSKYIYIYIYIKLSEKVKRCRVVPWWSLALVSYNLFSSQIHKIAWKTIAGIQKHSHYKKQSQIVISTFFCLAWRNSTTAQDTDQSKTHYLPPNLESTNSSQNPGSDSW